MPPDDQEITTAFRAGEPGALDTAYRAYGRRVMAFARQLTGNQADAEDLTQEAFLAAHAGRRSFRGGSSLLTWLFGIAARRWRDSRRPRSASEVLVGDLPAGVRERAAGTAPGPGIDAIRLRQAVETLDPSVQAAFHLVIVQGLTHAEAALAMGRPVGTVKWYTATALRRLREVLQDDSPPEPQGVQQDTARGPDRAAEGRTGAAARVGAPGTPVEVRDVLG